VRIPIDTLIHSITSVTIIIYLSSIPLSLKMFPLFNYQFIRHLICTPSYQLRVIVARCLLQLLTFLELNICTADRLSARSRTRVCWRSLARTEGSNPAGGMDVCLLSVLCVVSTTESYLAYFARCKSSSGVYESLFITDTELCTFFYVLLTVHLSLFISVINQLDAQNFCFTISLFYASTCSDHHVLIVRRSKLYYIIQPLVSSHL
jgi:hypothetical protein